MAELLAHLHRMEDVLGDGPFFGGDEFGLLDIAFMPFSSMFYGYEQHDGVDMAAEFPTLLRWVGGATKGRVCSHRESTCTIYTRSFYGIQ
jgi:glutathione S-transferase